MRAAGVLILVYVLLAVPGEGRGREWTTGRLLSAEINGHGSGVVGRGTKTGTRSDIWWTYRISAKTRIYSAATRENPARFGMAVGSPVRFAAEKKLLYILDSSGSIHTLRIVRSDTVNSSR